VLNFLRDLDRVLVCIIEAGVPHFFGLRRHSAATTALFLRARVTSSRRKSGVALRFPPRSISQPFLESAGIVQLIRHSFELQRQSGSDHSDFVIFASAPTARRLH